MKRFLIKLTIKLLTWLRDKMDIAMDLNKNDKNDLTEWIEFLTTKLEK